MIAGKVQPSRGASRGIAAKQILHGFVFKQNGRYTARGKTVFQQRRNTRLSASGKSRNPDDGALAVLFFRRPVGQAPFRIDELVN